MTAIPSDAYIRLMLDGALPTAFDPLFFKAIEIEGVLTPFQRLGGRTLIALDETEHFCSRKIHCKRCSTRRRSDGGTEYFHAFVGASIVAPGHTRVLPLPPEFVSPQDGAEKQDCERNAAKRWLARHGPAVIHLRLVYLGDDLFACQPIAEAIRQVGGNFILTCKPLEKICRTSSGRKPMGSTWFLINETTTLSERPVPGSRLTHDSGTARRQLYEGLEALLQGARAVNDLETAADILIVLEKWRTLHPGSLMLDRGLVTPS